MAACAYCGTTILFGGRREEDLRFCNDTCHANGSLLAVAQQVPEELVRRETEQVHQGPCPQCQQPETVDVHVSYWVWSALVVTSWSNRPRISCRSCAQPRQLLGIVCSAVLGWWGLPWGFIMTPVQIVRGIGAVLGGPDPSRPSARLTGMVRLMIAQQAMQQQPGGS